MANALKIDLKDKWVNIKGREKKFLCKDGSGCSPTTMGIQIYGYYEGELNSQGKPYMENVSGYTVTGLAN